MKFIGKYIFPCHSKLFWYCLASLCFPRLIFFFWDGLRVERILLRSKGWNALLPLSITSVNNPILLRDVLGALIPVLFLSLMMSDLWSSPHKRNQLDVYLLMLAVLRHWVGDYIRKRNEEKAEILLPLIPFSLCTLNQRPFVSHIRISGQMNPGWHSKECRDTGVQNLFPWLLLN